MNYFTDETEMPTLSWKILTHVKPFLAISYNPNNTLLYKIVARPIYKAYLQIFKYLPDSRHLKTQLCRDLKIACNQLYSMSCLLTVWLSTTL